MAWAQLLSKASRQRREAWAWLVALAIFGACLGLRILLAPWLVQMKFLTFYPGIAVATLICGWPQGVLVLLLSAVAAWYFFFEPFDTFSIPDSTTLASLFGFILVAGFILLLVAAMRELVHRLERANLLQEELFRELQHRVANNLQIAVVLLRNARRRTRDPDACEAISQAEERIDAMSRLHRRLHDGTAFAEGLRPLVEDVVKETFRDLNVQVRIDLEPNVELSLDQITALVLLVHEAAMNSAKHVFSKGLGRRFEVSLSREESGRFLLVVRDDGPGIASEKTEGARAAPSLGMSIMEAFARQLGGPLEVTPAPGATLRVEFQPV